MEKFLLPCGICDIPCSHLGARGHTVVCRACEIRATTHGGRPLEFREGFKEENGVIFFLGPGAYFKEPDHEAGVQYSEIWDKGIWIDGRQVELYEGVAGWIGLIVR